MADEGNPILKRIKLILDKASAKKTEEDTKKHLGGTEKALVSLEKIAKRVGAALAGAFVFTKLVAFGRESVRMAMESEAVWNRLATAIGSAGKVVDEEMPKLQALAGAWQDATIHDDEEFAQGLQQLLAITNDYEASLNNMGLVANVAARYFNGELEPAIEAVGRAMVGQTRLLRPLGINFKDAQQALDELANRSMGAATREADTMQGKVKQLNNAWSNFKEAVGQAMIEAGDGASIVDTLTGAIVTMTSWVETNTDRMQDWAETITSTAGALAELLGLTSGAERGAAIEISSIKKQTSAYKEQDDQIKFLATRWKNLIIEQNQWKTERTRLQEGLDDIRLFKDTEADKQAIAELTENIEQADIVMEWLRKRIQQVQERGPVDLGFGNRPQMSRTATVAATPLSEVDKEAIKITEAMRTKEEQYITTVDLLRDHLEAGRISQETFNRSIKAAAEEMVKEDKVASDTADAIALRQRRLAEVTAQLDTALKTGAISQTDYNKALAATVDALAGGEERLQARRTQAAEIIESVRTPTERYTTALQDLDRLYKENLLTVEQYTRAIKALNDERTQIDPEVAALSGYQDFLKDQAMMLTLGIIDPMAALQQEESALISSMQALADAGVGPLDERMLGLTDRLGKVRGEMKLMEQEATLVGEIASAVGDVVGAAFGGGMGELAKAKARQNAILAAEELAHAAAAAAGLFTAVKAPVHLAAAAKYAAIAAAWGTFGAMVGGGGGGGGGVNAAANAQPTTRDVGGRNAERVERVGTEIHVHFVGEGFSAVNPEVQRITYGAIEEYKRNSGPNAKVLVHRR